MSDEKTSAEETPAAAPRPAIGEAAPRPAPRPSPSKRDNGAGAPATATATGLEKPVPAQPLDAVGELDESHHDAHFLYFAAVPSWLVSLVVHLIIILALALTFLPAMPTWNADLTLGQPDVNHTELTNLEENATEIEIHTDALTSEVSVTDAPEIETQDPALVDDPLDTEAATMNVELSNIGFEATATDLMQEIGAFSGSGLDGRTAAERTRLVREAGGTEGSEQAVKRALQWLKRHQHPDGGWNFFHLGGRCPCTGHGTLAEARIGATAMALLPYLGAGNTHMSGNYKAEVQNGLYFLLNSQNANGSLWEKGGQMYSHGLAAIVLCEAYAMTGDPYLQKPAQAALNFIAYAQDRVTGGWRYKPGELGGDTSVVGWQLMALKSGHMANLQVSPATVIGTKKFLNSVQAHQGATYGYMAPSDKRPSMTAVGLLCRMYLGWNHDHPPLVEGVQRLSKSAPSKVNLYYDYYATQVMRHYGGEEWEKWNEEMREHLVKTQSRKGHADGSWLLGKDHTDKGGRLYCTSMATMILEVYYRHLPIYGKQASEVEFEL